MNILSIDTTNNFASTAVMSNNKILSYNITEERSQQAEKLFQLIELSLQQSKLQLSDIDLVSVTNGPGSFTGVRVGLAAVMGMQMAHEIKYIALSNFQVLAYAAATDCKQGEQIAVVLDARREQVYYQLFNRTMEELSQSKLLAIEDLQFPRESILVGDAVKFFPNRSSFLEVNADAKLLANASKYFLEANRYSALEPLYIREPDVLAPKV